MKNPTGKPVGDRYKVLVDSKHDYAQLVLHLSVNETRQL